MDLGAYANIGEEDIEQIVKANGIEVPRLRGYRLMKDEEKVDLNTLWTKEDDANCVSTLCTSLPFWSVKSYASEYSEWTDYLKKLYLYPDCEGSYFTPKDVRWNMIHGKKRRILKTLIHNEKKRKLDQYRIWNKYAGKEDILYIHARIGGSNWSTYAQQVINQPWFIEKVDDCYDSTYCDIYARITDKN